MLYMMHWICIKKPYSTPTRSKKVNPDKVLVLIKSSLWRSAEVRTLSGFDCNWEINEKTVGTVCTFSTRKTFDYSALVCIFHKIRLSCAERIPITTVVMCDLTWEKTSVFHKGICNAVELSWLSKGGLVFTAAFSHIKYYEF